MSEVSFLFRNYKQLPTETGGMIMSYSGCTMVVTNACDMACKYCYVQRDAMLMTSEIMSVALQEAAIFFNGLITVNWTGGEPLILGRKFFEHIEAVQADLGKDRFTNIIRTNLFSLDDWFIDFFARNKFLVRTSLDFPPENHEVLRAEGNFAETLQKIEKLKKAGVPVNINTVVTQRNVGDAKGIFECLKEFGVTSFSISKFVQPENMVQHPELIVSSDEDFAKFLIELFELWMTDKREPLIDRVTPLNNFLAVCQTGAGDRGVKCFSCQDRTFTVSPKGDIFPFCIKFLEFSDTCLGNVMSTGLLNIIHSSKAKRLFDFILDVSNRDCGACDFVDLCEGGCPYVAYKTLVQNETDSCMGYDMLFRHILQSLRKEVTP